MHEDRLEPAELLARASTRRIDLVARLRAEGTDCWRVLHGATEGLPGVAVDRYGPLLLVQVFRSVDPEYDVDAFVAAVRATAEPDVSVVVTDRRGERGPEGSVDQSTHEVVCHERGMRCLIRTRHQGIDPWLFLDLRVARRRLAELSRERSVLNLFAYTCTAGIAAALAGATEVWNVDFSPSWLDIGRRNARLNELDGSRVRFQRADCLGVLRQLAGIPVGRYPQRFKVQVVERRQFDVVMLDPPRLARSALGKVDLVSDYQSLFKPAWLATADGGALIATNNVASVNRDAWVDSITRCATKAGRAIREIELLDPDEDFPSPDGRCPLKIAVCHA